MDHSNGNAQFFHAVHYGLTYHDDQFANDHIGECGLPYDEKGGNIMNLN